MGNWVQIYKCGIEDRNGHLTDISFTDFIDEIDLIQDDREIVMRRIGYKVISIFLFITLRQIAVIYV